MFRKNEQHRQIRFLSGSNELPARLQRSLERSWAAAFYDQVFGRIDVDCFAVLHSENPSGPNILVNALMGLEVLKAMTDLGEARQSTARCVEEQYMQRLHSVLPCAGTGQYLTPAWVGVAAERHRPILLAKLKTRHIVGSTDSLLRIALVGHISLRVCVNVPVLGNSESWGRFGSCRRWTGCCVFCGQVVRAKNPARLGGVLLSSGSLRCHPLCYWILQRSPTSLCG